ncbi:MAG: autotransporter-associated beta strand repeat-containing protein [Planctomycetia bacterium]|nr:autotransporter-associated beta strand repeat-containing protein [Planctomycetia bacterium]
MIKRFFFWGILVSCAGFAMADVVFDGTNMTGSGTYSDAIDVSNATGQTVTITPSAQIDLYSTVTGSGKVINANTTGGVKVVLRGDWSGFSGTYDTTGVNWTEVFTPDFTNTAWKVAGGNAVAFCASQVSNDPYTFYLGALYGGVSTTEVRSSGGSSKAPVKVVVGNTNGALVSDEVNVFAGKIVDNNPLGLGIEKVGPGMWTLSGTNTYSLGTTISGGTLRVTGSILENSIVINAGGTLELSGTGNLTASNSVAGNDTITNHGIFRINKDSNDNLNRVVTGTGNLVKEGSGTLTVSVASDYSGYTEVKGGTLSSNYANLASRDFRIAEDATLTLTFSSDTTFNATVSGTGTFAKSGTHKLLLQGADFSNFSGTITTPGNRWIELFDAGSDTTVWNINGSQGLAFATHGGNSRFAFGTLTGSGAIIISNNQSTEMAVTLTVGNSDKALLSDAENIFSGSLADRPTGGTLAVEKIGPGMWTLSGKNTYTGGTTVAGGTLKIADTGSVASSVTVNAGTGDEAPSLILEGRIDGDLNLNGIFTVDFINDLTPTGSVSGDVTFGDDAFLSVLVDEPSIAMSYILNARSLDFGSRSLAEIYSASVAAGLLDDIWVPYVDGTSLILSVDGSKVPEPGTWLLLLLGLCLCRRFFTHPSLKTGFQP